MYHVCCHILLYCLTLTRFLLSGLVSVKDFNDSFMLSLDVTQAFIVGSMGIAGDFVRRRIDRSVGRERIEKAQLAFGCDGCAGEGRCAVIRETAAESGLRIPVRDYRLLLVRLRWSLFREDFERYLFFFASNRIV